MKKPADELPLEEPLRWTVEPLFYRQTKRQIELGSPQVLKYYALKYAGVIQKKATFERDVERLREMASFCNKRGLAPRPALQCLADRNIAPLPKKMKWNYLNPTEPTP